MMPRTIVIIHHRRAETNTFPQDEAAMLKTHPSVTLARVQAAYEEDAAPDSLPGFCIECGAEAGGVDPGAERKACSVCGRPGVFGAAQLFLLMTGW